VVNRQFAGGSLDWLTPFTLFCGAALVVAYALLGCTWLIMKTEGRCRSRCTTWRGRWRSCCWR
jgi:cytochrome d ubiquinol oxidase subunit II